MLGVEGKGERSDSCKGSVFVLESDFVTKIGFTRRRILEIDCEDFLLSESELLSFVDDGITKRPRFDVVSRKNPHY